MSTTIYLILTTFAVSLILSVPYCAAQNAGSAGLPGETERQSEGPPPETVAPSVENQRSTAPASDRTNESNKDSVAARPEGGQSAAASDAGQTGVDARAPEENKTASDQSAQGTTSGTATKEPSSLRMITDQSAPQSGPPQYHRVQMRLSGSMCFACLNTLKKKLKQVYGVEKVRIERPINNLFQPYAPDVSSWADSAMIYDAARVALPDLRTFIRSNGYISYKVVDKPTEESLESFKEGK